MECGGQRPPRVCDGASTQSNNLVEVTSAQFGDWFAHPDAVDFRFRDARALIGQGAGPAPADDFCGRALLSGQVDIGAVAYLDGQPCDTTDGGGGDDRRFFGG